MKVEASLPASGTNSTGLPDTAMMRSILYGCSYHYFVEVSEHLCQMFKVITANTSHL